MPSYNQTIIIKKEDEDVKGILNFEPKHLDVDISIATKNFTSEQKPELAQPFKIDDLISKQTGIFENEKKKVEIEINERVLEKIKDVQEKAYKEAYDLGLQEGKKTAFEKHNETIKNDLSEMSKLLESVRNMKKDLLNETEGLFIDFLYYICEKVVGEHVERSETIIKEVLKQVIESLDSKENISVQINDEDFKIVQKLMQEANQESEIYKKIKFYPSDEIEKGGCVFETDHGLVDATLKERLDKLWTTLNENKPANSKG